VATADILTDITTWVTYYVLLNGYPPGGMLISRQTLNQMLSNTALRTATGTILGPNSLLSRTVLDQAFDAHGIPPIQSVYDTQVDVDGTFVRVLPANKVVFVPPDPAQLGYTAWGVTATSLELVGSSEVDFSFENAPGIVGVVDKDGPPYREMTFVDAVGMPVLENPRALMIATVA
jgi:hypothetical protein